MGVSVKEMQQALKTYSVEKSKLLRMERVMNDLITTSSSSPKKLHLELSEVVPRKPQQSALQTPFGTYYVQAVVKNKRETELSKLLGIAVEEKDVFDILIILHNRKKVQVKKMGKELVEKGIEI